VVNLDWAKFHWPVFSAAYLGCVHFNDEIVQILRDEFEIYQVLEEDTVAVILQMLRRFNPDGAPRSALLTVDEVEILYEEEIKENLLSFVNKSEMFDGVKYHAFTKSPAEWWVFRAPKCLIKRFMGWICSLAPSSSPVERMHKLFKGTRTKTRNILGYPRAFALNFIADRYTAVHDQLSQNWDRIKNYQKKFEKLGEGDLQFLQKQEEADDAALAEVQELEEEGLPIPAPQRRRAAVAEEEDEELSAINRERITRSGRVVRPRAWL
jgi:hypothetical protein